MSGSDPVHDGPREQEPLEELFGSVFDLADRIASRISPDTVETRLRRTLRDVGQRPGETPAGQPDRTVQIGKSPARSLSMTTPIDPVTLGVVPLVTRAVQGDRGAWEEIVDRYAPLVHSICTRYRLSNHDIEDVAQSVWLLLVEHLGKLREPAALPGWLATTTARECLRVVAAARKSGRLGTVLDDAALFVDDAVIGEEILTAERNGALREAFAGLPPRCQQLLAMLTQDPPRSYAEISAALQIPAGSIGPQRGRCLDRLRRSIALIALSEGETAPQADPQAYSKPPRQDHEIPSGRHPVSSAE